MGLFDRKKKEGIVIAQRGGEPNTPNRHHSLRIVVNPSKKEMLFYDGNDNIWDIHSGKIVGRGKPKQ